MDVSVPGSHSDVSSFSCVQCGHPGSSSGAPDPSDADIKASMCGASGYLSPKLRVCSDRLGSYNV